MIKDVQNSSKSPTVLSGDSNSTPKDPSSSLEDSDGTDGDRVRGGGDNSILSLSHSVKRKRKRFLLLLSLCIGLTSIVLASLSGRIGRLASISGAAQPLIGRLTTTPTAGKGWLSKQQTVIGGIGARIGRMSTQAQAQVEMSDSVRAESAVKTKARSGGGCEVDCPDTAGSGSKPKDKEKAQEQVKMSVAEMAKWNKMSDVMNQFHNHFRYEFDRVYKLADGGFHKEGMSLGRFLREAQQLSHHLTMHHSIESYIFPILAKKMPQFKAGARESGAHLKSHKAIHEGLDKYEKFLDDTLRDTSSYSAFTLRSIMDGFREVLYRHLDEEVEDLKGENLRKAGWTLAEISRIPM